ncbi:hypothetical protein GGI20_005577, partial [Coemansia sp. BCRC 34301]
MAECLQGRGYHLGLADLIGMLGLSESFSRYTANTSGMLAQVAQQLPLLANGHLWADKDSRGIQATPSSLTRAFRGIWESVRCSDKARYPDSPHSAECRFSDQRTMQAGGVPVKPDGVFYYPKYPGSEFYSVHALFEAQLEPSLDATSPDVLGKMADLALRAWEAQPTRLFVPFFYLHGPNVSLVLFARNGYYCVSIGRVFYTSSDPSADDVCDVEDTLRYLWFLLTLPADRFGHMVDASVLAAGLDLSKLCGSPTADSAGDDAMVLDSLQRIPLPVSLLGSQSYIFKTQYRGKPAMLKLVWTPTCRLPEAAIYDWLWEHKCGAVPKVYRSAIIAKDILGYRLECLLVKDCGVPLLEYIHGACDRDGDTFVRDLLAKTMFKQLASCLAIAHGAAGVLHCNISAEHIWVRDGQAFIVDWACMQLPEAGIPEELACALREKWGMDESSLQLVHRWLNEGWGTQTPIYASIRSLWHGETDCLLDRFESLLYVFLHALHLSNAAAAVAPPLSAFTVVGGPAAMALVKTGCLADPDMYLGYFGVSGIDPEFREFLDTIRRFLFYSRGSFIGGRLGDPNYQRVVLSELAKTFLSEEAFAAMYPDHGSFATTTGRGTTFGWEAPFSFHIASDRASNVPTVPATPAASIAVTGGSEARPDFKGIAKAARDVAEAANASAQCPPFRFTAGIKTPDATGADSVVPVAPTTVAPVASPTPAPIVPTASSSATDPGAKPDFKAIAKAARDVVEAARAVNATMSDP